MSTSGPWTRSAWPFSSRRNSIEGALLDPEGALELERRAVEQLQPVAGSALVDAIGHAGEDLAVGELRQPRQSAVRCGRQQHHQQMERARQPDQVGLRHRPGDSGDRLVLVEPLLSRLLVILVPEDFGMFRVGTIRLLDPEGTALHVHHRLVRAGHR